jgi:hypothetical protein
VTNEPPASRRLCTVLSRHCQRRSPPWVMDQVEVVRLLPGEGEDSQEVPAYAYPKSAVRAFRHPAHYGVWRATPQRQVPDLGGLRQVRARGAGSSPVRR